MVEEDGTSIMQPKHDLTASDCVSGPVQRGHVTALLRKGGTLARTDRQEVESETG